MDEVINTGIISIIIAAVAAIASAISSWYSRSSAKISKDYLEYQQAPVLTIKHKHPYLYIYNIGLGIAKKISWKGENLDIKSESLFSNILIPHHGPLTSNETILEGSESMSYPIAFNLKEDLQGKIFLEYENLRGKKFISEILIKRFKGQEYKVKFLRFYEK